MVTNGDEGFTNLLGSPVDLAEYFDILTNIRYPFGRFWKDSYRLMPDASHGGDRRPAGCDRLLAPQSLPI
jgi:hypothetical protein